MTFGKQKCVVEGTDGEHNSDVLEYNHNSINIYTKINRLIIHSPRCELQIMQEETKNIHDQNNSILKSMQHVDCIIFIESIQAIAINKCSRTYTNGMDLNKWMLGVRIKQ
eukprot:510548_1